VVPSSGNGDGLNSNSTQDVNGCCSTPANSSLPVAISTPVALEALTSQNNVLSESLPATTASAAFAANKDFSTSVFSTSSLSAADVTTAAGRRASNATLDSFATSTVTQAAFFNKAVTTSSSAVTKVAGVSTAQYNTLAPAADVSTLVNSQPITLGIHRKKLLQVNV
jgi:hypothetical protein